MKNIIGRYWIPTDNSYAINVTEGVKELKPFGNIIANDKLAGTVNSVGIICQVLTQPFKSKVKVNIGSIINKEETMIVVKDLINYNTHIVLLSGYFNTPLFTIKELQKRVKEINKHQKLNHIEERVIIPEELKKYFNY